MITLDFTQPSTWRGIAGFAALFGLSASPELTHAICLALGAVLSAIEIGHNEYATRNAALPPMVLQSLPAGVVAADVERVEQLRQPMPLVRGLYPPHAPSDDGVLAFLVCWRCNDRLIRGPIHRPACAQKRILMASFLIKCTPEETRPLMAEIETWISMEGAQ